MYWPTLAIPGSAPNESHVGTASPSVISTLFQGADLTFAAWVRHERLLRIRRDLLDPDYADRSTVAIARRWGVLDAKHLGRALESEFGETLSDLRRTQR